VTTNAERQALAELEKLCAEQQAELDQLRNAKPARSGDRMHDALKQIEKMLKQAPRGDPSRQMVEDALAYAKAAERRSWRSC
jgi:cytochrome c-type biogenesis protein CcmH/NrfG